MEAGQKNFRPLPVELVEAWDGYRKAMNAAGRQITDSMLARAAMIWLLEQPEAGRRAAIDRAARLDIEPLKVEPFSSGPSPAAADVAQEAREVVDKAVARSERESRKQGPRKNRGSQANS